MLLTDTGVRIYKNRPVVSVQGGTVIN